MQLIGALCPAHSSHSETALVIRLGKDYITYMLTKQEIVDLLVKSDKAVIRALIVLNERQTTDEQSSAITKYHNGRGFRPCDAFMGSKLAQFYLARGFLSPKQLAWARKTNKAGLPRLSVYWRQLAEAAEEKAKSQKDVA